MNLGTVEASSLDGVVVTDEDPGHYFGEETQILTQNSTDPEDADVPPAPIVPEGAQVEFKYRVTDEGEVQLAIVSVRDDNGTPHDPTDDSVLDFLAGDDEFDSLLENLEEIWTFAAPRT